LFGPDPGRLRLQNAGRSVVACSLALMATLGLNALGWMPTAGIGIGFMVAIFSTMMVAPGARGQQVVNFALLAIPPLPSLALATFLSQWQWAVDAGFVALAVAAILARQAGQRGIGMGMTAYIAYLMAAVLRSTLAELPLVLLAPPIGVLSAALVRFLVLPERPRRSLLRAGRDALNRLPLVLAALRRDLNATGEQREPPENRLHSQLARLEDAVLAAEQQLQSLPDSEQEPLHGLSDALFSFDLAAERVIRAIAFPRPPAERRAAIRDDLLALERRLTGAYQSAAHLDRAGDPVAAALAALEQSAWDLQAALAAAQT
jgi:uncharacterized membrane protein YccC